MSNTLNLRKGKTKSTLNASIDAALLAVEIYNKPRTSFRSEGFISLMIMAWTRLFHAYFFAVIGDKYYYKIKGSNRYQMIDGEKKSWELRTCVNEYAKLNGQLPEEQPYQLILEPVKENLRFFIGLRNKIEHRHIESRDVDINIFGECQALLYNYENLLIALFGSEYAISEALVYSLQFSHLRTESQSKSNRSALSKDVQNIYEYIDKFRNNLSDEEFNANEFSIKILQIPKISNTNRSDAAIEFLKWDELDDKEKEDVNRLVTIVKNKAIRVEGANIGRLKPKNVCDAVNEAIGEERLSPSGSFAVLWKVFDIRPDKNAEDPFDTNTTYCHFDEPHQDYVYQEKWVEFLIQLFSDDRFSMKEARQATRDSQKWDITEYGGTGK